MNKIFNLFILTLICSLAGTAKAIESTWYEVEILVFEQSDVTRLNSEKWDQKIPLVDTDKSLDFISPDPSLVKLDQLCLNGSLVDIKEMIAFSLVEEPQDITDKLEVSGAVISTTELSTQLITEIPTEIEAELVEELPFQILSKEFNQLDALETTLRRSRGFRSLMHVTWRQPVDSKKSSKLMRLYTGKNYSDTFNPEGDARVDIATYIADTTETEQVQDLSEDTNTFQGSFVGSTENTENSDIINPLQTEQDKRKQQFNNCQQLQQEIADKKNQDVWQIDGNIRLYVKRYLHLETDLMLRIPGKVEIQLGAIETSLAADRLLSNLSNDLDSGLDTENSILDKQNQSSDDGFGWQLGNDFLTNDQNTTVIQQDFLNKYSMRQSIRMRSNEIHYIDHPLFGILVEIRSYDKDAVNNNDDTQTNNAN
jgi:hypothetical protein